ncbi:hypothetical protein LWI28_015050 [Acer negundo]|uniref:Non-haem dioxygenase N-terminal domain-containing protein n=1 Tax=Acer negundo TaxID=4023 RepID=A0AAD5J0N8_ACENE|nr:hypothetical protein LWI28_015050 [Acer negundo]
MEGLVSSLFDVRSLPETYVLPPEIRPGELSFRPDESNNIPVLDLGGHDRNEIIKQIMKASQEFGFFQIVSNDKLNGAEHRVVTNSSDARTTVSFFIYPSSESIIEPAKALVSASSDHPPLYRALKFKDFHVNFLSKSADAEAVHDFVSSKNI